MYWVIGTPGVWFLGEMYGLGGNVLSDGEWIIRCRRRRNRS